MNIEKDLVAASSIPLVLSILDEGDNYGYAIIKRVKELSDKELEWSEGMLYPVLHKLERQGWIAAYWDNPEGGRRRKYYRLERAGLKGLENLKKQWDTVDSTLRSLWDRHSWMISQEHLRRHLISLLHLTLRSSEANQREDFQIGIESIDGHTEALCTI
jgi:PadR family transcriptional regulator, regulatory protein PadR